MFSFFPPSSHFSYRVLPSCRLPDHILTHMYNQLDSNFRISVFRFVTLRRCVRIYETDEGTHFLRHLPKDLNPHLQRCQNFKTRKIEICFKFLIR
jgi:hypothetical protein